MTDLLDPSALLQVLQELLPTASKADTVATTRDGDKAFGPTSDLELRHAWDALSAMIHTIMSRLDFRLVGFSEDDRILPHDSSTQSEAATTTFLATNKLSKGWNAKGPDHYCFRYKHDQSSLDYLVKVIKLGNKAIIHGVALQGSRTSTLEIPLSDYFSPSFFPYPSSSGDNEPLVNGYISSSRLKDLVIAFKTQILQTLVPGLRKQGYTEDASNSNTGVPSSPSTSSPRPSVPDPTRSLQQPPHRNPLIIGDHDLDPLGGSPLALPPRFGGDNGGGFAPPPLFPGGDTGGGMFVGPNHPMFRDRFPTGGGRGGPFGDLPPGAVPPGARFDPIFPSADGDFPGNGGGLPRFDPFHPAHPDVGGARPQGGNGSRFPPLSGEPDWDDIPQPGSNGPRPPHSGGGGGRNLASNHWYS